MASSAFFPFIIQIIAEELYLKHQNDSAPNQIVDRRIISHSSKEKGYKIRYSRFLCLSSQLRNPENLNV